MDSNVKKTLQNKRFRVVRTPDAKMNRIHDPMEEVRRSTKMAGEHAHDIDPIPQSFYQPEHPINISVPWYSSLWNGVVSAPGAVWKTMSKTPGAIFKTITGTSGFVWRNVSSGAILSYSMVSGSLSTAYHTIINFFIDLYKSIGNYSVSMWTSISDMFVMLWRGIFGFPDEEDTFTSPLVA